MRLDDRVCSGWFAVEQGLNQGCVLAPLLFNIFFARVMNVTVTRLTADKDIMDALVYLRRKTGAGGSNRGRASLGDITVGNVLRGRCQSHLVIDRAGEEDDRRDRGRVCRVWSRRIGGQYSNHVFTHGRGAAATAIFSVEVAGQSVQPNERLRIPRGGDVSHNTDLSNEVDPSIRNG